MNNHMFLVNHDDIFKENTFIKEQTYFGKSMDHHKATA